MKKDDLDITIPDRYYVGFQARSDDPVPLGFMTPDDDKADRRKAQVDRWSSGKIAPITYVNFPLSGFRFRKTINRYSRYSSGETKWRLQDPRGFEQEITSENLLHILESCVIKDGVILEPCIWARRKNANILVPTASEFYEQALSNKQRVEKVVSAKDAEIGDELFLHDGRRVTFLGKYKIIERGYGNAYASYKISAGKLFVILVNNQPVVMHKLSISEITKPEVPMSEIEAERLANNDEYFIAISRIKSRTISYKQRIYSNAIPPHQSAIFTVDDQDYYIPSEREEYNHNGGKSYFKLNSPLGAPEGADLERRAIGSPYSKYEYRTYGVVRHSDGMIVRLPRLQFTSVTGETYELVI